jgi:hypothetical protein
MTGLGRIKGVFAQHGIAPSRPLTDALRQGRIISGYVRNCPSRHLVRRSDMSGVGCKPEVLPERLK